VPLYEKKTFASTERFAPASSSSSSSWTNDVCTSLFFFLFTLLTISHILHVSSIPASNKLERTLRQKV
jgi:hypothetical protein